MGGSMPKNKKFKTYYMSLLKYALFCEKNRQINTKENKIIYEFKKLMLKIGFQNQYL